MQALFYKQRIREVTNDVPYPQILRFTDRIIQFTVYSSRVAEKLGGTRGEGFPYVHEVIEEGFSRSMLNQ